MSYLINSPTFIGNVTINTGGLILPASYGITIPTGAPGVTTDKLYNNAGVLTFNGSALGGGSVTLTDDTTTNATYYPVVATTAGGSTLKTSSTQISFNPSTGALTAVKYIVGSYSFNAFKSGNATGNNIWVGNGGTLSTSSTAAFVGSNNTAVGHNACLSITEGYGNTAFGTNALQTVTTNVYNTAVGTSALQTNRGSCNTAVGYNALQALGLTTGDYNTAVGYSAAAAQTNGIANVAIGSNAITTNTLGSYNTVIGTSAFTNYNNITNNTTGRNTVIGWNTGLGITTGTDNTIIGANVSGLATTLSSNIILATGSGAIKAQFDGTNWTLTGTTVTLTGSLTIPTAQGIILTNGAPGVTTSKLYAIAGALYWNGSAVGGGSVSITDDGTTDAEYYPITETGVGSGSLASSSNALSYNPAKGRLSISKLGILDPYSNVLYGGKPGVDYSLTTSAIGNVFIGYASGLQTLDATYNVGIGYSAGGGITGGGGNIAIGYQAGYSSGYTTTTPSNCIAIGYQAGNISTNHAGYNNIAIGNLSQLYTARYAGDNVSVGSASLWYNRSGSSNIAIGTGSLDTIRNSSYNTCIGWNAGHFVAETNNAISAGQLIDYNSTVAGTCKVTFYSNHLRVNGDTLQIFDELGTYTGSYTITVINATSVYFTKTYVAYSNELACTFGEADNNVFIGSRSGYNFSGKGNTRIGAEDTSASNIKENDNIEIFSGLLSRIKYTGSTGVWALNNSGSFVLSPATTAGPSINIPSGIAPTSPVNGDMWYDGTHLYFQSTTARDLLGSGSGMTNPMTTLGDMISGGASGAPARLVGPTTNGTYGLRSIPTASVAVAPTWVLGTGTGAPVSATSPTLVTPVLGVATATSINKLTITAPATSATLTLVTGSSLITTGAFAATLNMTANSTVTMPASTSAVMNYYTTAPAANAIPYAGAASGLLSYLAPQTTNGVYVLSANVVASAAVSPTWVLASSLGEPALGNPGVSGYMLTSTTGGVRSWVAVPGAGTGSPGGSNTYVQYNASNLFAGSANFTYDAATFTLALLGTNPTLDFGAVTTDPTAPAANNITIYGKNVGGRMLPKWVGPSGIDTPFQPFLGMNHIRLILVGSGTTTALAITANGCAPTVTAAGTNTQSTPATGTLKSRTRYVGLATAATAGQLSAIRGQQLECARETGFYMVMRFGLETMIATQNVFFGLYASASAIGATTNLVTANTARVGLACASNAGNWQLVIASGSAVTAVDLGATFPINNTDLMELVLFSAPGGSVISYRVTNMTSAVQVSGDFTMTNAPANTTYMTYQMHMTNNAAASIVKWNFKSFYLETDY